jgi:hypothetical protein
MAQQQLVLVVAVVDTVLALGQMVAQAVAEQVVGCHRATELLAQSTLAVAVAVHQALQLMVQPVAPVLSSSATSGGNVVQAVQSHRLVATPSIHLHRLPRI